MNKKLEKLYRYCKANGYDESCETFESDLNQLLIQQVEGDELSMVAGGRSATKTLAATLISVLSIASPFASANQNGTSRNISTKNAFSVSPSKNAPSNKKSRMDLLKNILLKGVLPVAGLGTVGICLEELIRRKPWEKKDTKPANQTSEKVLQKQKEQHQAKEEKPNADEQTKKEQEKEGDRTLQSLGQDTKEKEKEEQERLKQQEEQRLAEEAKRNLEKLVQSMFYKNCFSMDFAKIATAWQNQVSPINLANACVQELLKRNNNNIFDTVQKLNDAKRSYYRKSLDLMEWNRIFTPGSSLLGCQSQLGQIRWFASLFDEEIDNILKYDLWKKLSPEEYSEIFFKHN